MTVADSGTGGSSGYIRFEDGIQLCFGTVAGNASGVKWRFPAFFVNNQPIVTGSPTQDGTARVFTVGPRTFHEADLKLWAWSGGGFVLSGVPMFADAKGVWKDPAHDVIAKFEEISRTTANQVAAWQAALFTGSNYFGSSGAPVGSPDPANQAWEIYKYDAAYNLIATIDTETFTAPPGSHRQANGLHYDAAADLLYICANNYQNPGGAQPSDRGWVFIVNATTGALVSSHDLGAKLTEAVFPWNGEWWEVNATAWEIRRFDAAWSLLGTYPLPGDYTGDGVYGQGIFVIADIFYINDHGPGGVGSGRLRAYRWTGSGFAAVAQDLRRPTENCSQNVYYDGAHTWWAERVAGVGSYLVKATAATPR